MPAVLLIDLPVVFEPTCHVPPVRVVVRPVDHASLFVPHVLAVEAYAIASLQPVDPLSDVDVVRNKDRLTRCEANNESLMPAASEVICQHTSYYALTLNLYITRPVFERAPELTVVASQGAIVSR